MRQKAVALVSVRLSDFLKSIFEVQCTETWC